MRNLNLICHKHYFNNKFNFHARLCQILSFHLKNYFSYGVRQHKHLNQQCYDTFLRIHAAPASLHHIKPVSSLFRIELQCATVEKALLPFSKSHDWLLLLSVDFKHREESCICKAPNYKRCILKCSTVVTLQHTYLNFLSQDWDFKMFHMLELQILASIKSRSLRIAQSSHLNPESVQIRAATNHCFHC